MGFDWLDYGFAGAVEAAAIACVIGFVLFTLAHSVRRLFRWRQGTEIGVALALALLLGAGVDAWDLFYLSVVRLEAQSPFAIQQTLAQIHDPDALGARVVLEFIGAVVGVMLGWATWAKRG